MKSLLTTLKNSKNIKSSSKTVKLFLLVFVLGVFAQSCHKGGPYGIKGKGQSVTEIRNLSSFDKINLSIDADIFYTQDTIYKVEISAQENILPILKSEVDNLTLSFDFRRNVWEHGKIKIIIHTPDLTEVRISGSGNITAENTLNTRDMEINISGTGSVFFPALNARSLKTTISGSGDLKISGGMTKTETFSVSGFGDIDTKAFTCDNCVCKISGSGDIMVNVIKSLDVTISGSGDVSYLGNPEVSTDISGSGKLIHLK